MKWTLDYLSSFGVILLIERKIWYCCLQFIILIIVWPKIFYAAHLDDFWLKKKRKIYTHTTARSVKEVQLISYDWTQWKEKYQRYTHWNIMIMMIFHSGKNNRKKTDFLWIFKWEMLTSFSQNNVTLHNFSVLIIIQVLAVQCKYDEDIFNFNLLKSDQLEGVF